MVEKTEWKILLGKRVLWKRCWSDRGVHEAVVTEVPFSGDYVKLEGQWVKVNTIECLEVLKEKTKDNAKTE